MPFDSFGTAPEASECADLGRLPLAVNAGNDAPPALAGLALPDSARIREAVFLLSKRGGSHSAKIALRGGLATIRVGPDGWAVERGAGA